VQNYFLKTGVTPPESGRALGKKRKGGSDQVTSGGGKRQTGPGGQKLANRGRELDARGGDRITLKKTQAGITEEKSK